MEKIPNMKNKEKKNKRKDKQNNQLRSIEYQTSFKLSEIFLYNQALDGQIFRSKISFHFS